MIDLASFIAIYGLGASVATLATKVVYTKMDHAKEVKDIVLNQGLYHVTSKENADKIRESGYFKPSNVLLSLGRRKTFFFAGRPDYDTLMQNVAEIDSYEFTALKVKLTEEQLVDYKVRKYSDNAVVCNGRCMLQDKQVEKVSLVLDMDEKGNIFTREKDEGEEYQPKQELIDKINLKPSKMPGVKNLLLQALKLYGKVWFDLKDMGYDFIQNLTRREEVKFLNAGENVEFESEPEKDKMQIMKENFENSIKVDLSKLPQIPQKVKKTRTLCKEKMSYLGKNVKEKIGKIIETRKSKKRNEDVERE